MTATSWHKVKAALVVLFVPVLVIAAACGDDGGNEPAWVAELSDHQVRWCALDAVGAGMGEAEARTDCELPWTFTGAVPVRWGMSLDYGAMGSAEAANQAAVQVTLNPDGSAEAMMTYPPEGNMAFFIGGCNPASTGGNNAQAGTVTTGPLPTKLVTKWIGTHSEGKLELTAYDEYLLNGANIGIGKTTLTSDLTYTREQVSGNASSVTVNDPIGCGNSTYTENHDWTGIARVR